MEYKIFLKSYYLRLRKSLPFNSWNFVWVVLLVLMGSCSEKKKESTIVVPQNISRKILEFHKNGKPKVVELYSDENGKKVIVGLEELYEEGQIKIKGAYNEKHQRQGVWKSFYVDGTEWSVGEYDNGVENGEKKVWYPNGKLRYQGDIKNGKPVGTWTFWDEQGIKTEKEY